MKGLSPLISAILLMLITVAAVGAAYLFLNAMQSRIQLRTQETIEHTLSKGEIQLQYVECTINSSTNKTQNVTVYVKNVGTVDIPVDGDVTLLVSDTDGTAKFLAYQTVSATWSTGKIYSLTFNNNINISEKVEQGERYSVKLTLPDGTYAVGECVYK